jgi:phage/plasmid-associated DNA primase
LCVFDNRAEARRGIPRAVAGLDPNNEDHAKKISATTNKYLGWQHVSESKVRLTAMSSLAESFVPIEMHRFDRDLMLFNVQNGTINLHTGELRPHSRENFITNVSPVIYDPKAECPLWLEFLNTVTAGNQASVPTGIWSGGSAQVLEFRTPQE